MQSGRNLLVLVTIITVLLTVTLKVITPVMAAGKTENVEATVGQQVQAIIPTSRQLVDGAIAVLSKGWRGMSPAEREAFLALYDPAGTGEIDEEFVEAVLANYQIIREKLGGEIAVVYEPDNSKCEDMRLYYTDLVKLHVCPYYLTEKDEVRKARTLIHEMAHIVLRVRDRPYYRPTSKAFAELTPKGPWTTQLPVIGPIVREIVASDTLYHPDTYAHFALAMSGQPGAVDNYLDQGSFVTIARTDDDAYGHGSDYQVTDSWLGS